MARHSTISEESAYSLSNYTYRGNTYECDNTKRMQSKGIYMQFTLGHKTIYGSQFPRNVHVDKVANKKWIVYVLCNGTTESKAEHYATKAAAMEAAETWDSRRTPM